MFIEFLLYREYIDVEFNNIDTIFINTDNIIYVYSSEEANYTHIRCKGDKVVVVSGNINSIRNKLDIDTRCYRGAT